MSEIDELFVSFMADVPDAPSGARERVTRRAMAGSAADVVPHRRRRLLMRVAGSLGAAAVAAIVAFLFVQAPKSSNPATAPRVDWGLTVTARVIPDAGVEATDAVDRAVAALGDRARVRDIPGLRVERSGSTELTIAVPGAKRQEVVAELTSFNAIAIYDRTATRLAHWDTVEQAKAGLRSIVGSPGGYITVPRRPGSSIGITDYAATRPEIDKVIAFLNATVPNEPDKQWEALQVPAGVRFRDTGKGLDVFRDEPMVGVSDVDRASVSGDGVVLDIRPDAQARVADAFRSTPASAPVAVRTFMGAMAETVGDAAYEDGRVTIRVTNLAGAALIAAGAGTPIVPARLETLTAEPYGSMPPLEGDRGAPLPADVDAARRRTPDPRSADARTLDVPVDAIVHAVTATLGRRTQDLYVGRTPNGDDVVYLSGDFEGATTGCDGHPGPPSLVQCGGGGSGTRWLSYGRVGRPDITRVELHVNGTVVPGTVGNGWFIVLGDVATVGSAAGEIIGFNDAGDELARIDGNGLHLRPS